MTEHDEQDDGDERERREQWQAFGLRTDIAHPARVYNYLLGGKDHFAADRELAEASLRIQPQILDSARANRKFQVRAVRFLHDLGIRQFLDIGTGLPTSPNTHETAPDARVVYVDNDPVVFLHAEALMADHRDIRVVRADLRDVDGVLAAAGEVLDFGEPVALLFLACLHNIPDSDEPAGVVARYLAAVAPGSHLAISHVTGDFAPDEMKRVTEESARRGATFIGRTKDEVGEMFNGLELVEPGLVTMAYWRPDDGDSGYNADRVWGWCGVARV